MTGADTPSITVRQYGDAASIRSLILGQPDNTEFLLCWKGKYIVGITHVPAEAHFNVRYEYDNYAVIAHDFFANDPYPGVLTIDASESSDPTPVADFETELRAFLQTVGVSNVALSRVAQLQWWNTNAAFYETPVSPVTVPFSPLPLSSWNETAQAGDTFNLMFNYEGSFVLVEVKIVDSENFQYRYNTEGGGVLAYNGIDGEGEVTFDGTYTVDSEMDVADLQSAIGSTITGIISKDIDDGMAATDLVWSAVQCAIEF